MKEDFKKYLSLWKGKVLTDEIIKYISEKHEDEIGNMLYNEGLALESLDTGKNILYGSCEKIEKNWSVQNQWRTEREFKTLKGAIKFCNE